MDYFHNRFGTLLRGAVLFTLALTGGCLSSGGGSGSSGGTSVGGISSNPTVERVNPEANSTGAVITAIVLALFDRDMDAATIDSDSFTLTGPGGDVQGTVSCDSPCQTASFDPDDPLEIEESYTATLSDTITDTNGIPLESDIVWSFVTAPEMVRASTDANGIADDAPSRNAATDHSGRFVAFDSTADRLVVNDTNAASDVFVKDTQTGEIERVSVNAAGMEGDDNSTRPSISADGRYVAFESAASNLLSGVAPITGVQIYVKDRSTGEVTLVSVNDSGTPGRVNNTTDGTSTDASISADGRYVAFQSNARNLVALPPITAGIHVYVKDLDPGATEAIELASAAIGPGGSVIVGDANSTRPAISADGQFVAFQSASVNFGAAGEPQTQIFRKDLETGDLLLVSATDDEPPVPGAVPGDGISANPSISDDGRFVAFETSAPNLQDVASPAAVQIVRKDTEVSSDSLVVASADDLTGALGDDDSLAPSISDDGRYVAFQSIADNLVASPNNRSQIYVKDLETGASGPIEVVSRNALTDVLGNGDSSGAAITRDGGYVAFDSVARNLVPNDDLVPDVYRGYNNTFSP